MAEASEVDITNSQSYDVLQSIEEIISNVFSLETAITLLVLMGIALIMGMAFLALFSHKAFREVQSTSLVLLFSSFILLTLQISFGGDPKTAFLLTAPSMLQQFLIGVAILINTAVLLISFSKNRNNRKYKAFHESVLVLGIMQISVAMSMTSQFEKVHFLLLVELNSLYLVLPSLAIYELTKKKKFYER